ncbi:hypothetical protein GUITHDRAFT_91880 [Guillardia theta CCMP2712]|uniref:Uncharacterized protein n=1 Tax=Guillardia theta (strain CCMP2712) TaxID=905079 RepID=L1JYM4_GUITC|nr:hypothetical protein GUITHDRAFT_91880 [Guillardia theta CCMP2712]EKX53681.1 hypothetical protein GUITHDRAFT_91880 [Guillardia theta CCMP2712]|eukprot:XP_005840661.1 hypothetical protein GUITHDRAFT_91880 [Guillardia theta CCMP2712]
MVSKYAYPAKTGNEKETWIREIPLLVMIYEGIIAGVLDFDYAPVSVLVSQNGVSKRCFMNVTQEGKSAIDDLRERRLMNGLKLSSEDFQPVSCYQVSFHGLDFLERIPQKLRSDVDAFIYAPKPYQNKLLNVIMKREILDEEIEEVQNFYLIAEGGYERISGVTEIEDVSYVSSPYLPLIVRTGEKALKNNSHRASEAASGESNIKDELSEAIHLANVKILVGEWIPFGPNQIVALNERLGAMDRCQGGLFTSKIDKDPTSTQFQVPTGLTQVRILDYDLTHCINFEAEINYPEAEGIVQIENFGMHLNVDGTIIYGMGIEAIMERKADDISLDMLSRLLVDVQKDSSTIINDLLSAYQRSLLSMVFCNDEMNRCKYNLVLCESIDPKLQCEEYIDRGDNENELKQVIGDIQSAHNVGADDILILGRDGLILAGPNGRRYEKLILLHLSLLVREMFVRVFFIRTYVLDDSLKRIRKMILEHEKDPNNVPKLRIQLNDTSRDIILLEEIISYLLESLNSMEVPAMPEDEASATLYKALNLASMKRDVTHRVEDLRKLVHGAQNELQNLSSMTEMINTKQLEEIFRNVESNTKYLVDGSGTNERASASLEVMQMMLAGIFAFDVIDHISGGTLGLSTPWWVEQWINQPIVARFPFLWFALNLLWMVIFVYGVTRFMRYLSDLSSGFLTLHVRINAKINVEKMEMFLSDKRIDVTDTIEEPAMSIKKVSWQESDRILWAGGSPPKIEVAYDAQNGFLLTVLFNLDKKKSSLDEDGLMRIFTAVLAEYGVLEDYEPPRTALYDMEDRDDDKED